MSKFVRVAQFFGLLTTKVKTLTASNLGEYMCPVGYAGLDGCNEPFKTNCDTYDVTPGSGESCTAAEGCQKTSYSDQYGKGNIFTPGSCCTCWKLKAAPNYEDLWKSFKADFGKTYSSDGDEETKRYQAFKKNVDVIFAHNAHETDYKYGINAYTDLTTEEFMSTRLGWKKPNTSEMYADLPYLGEHTYQGEELPTAVDHVKDGLVTEIKDQAHCGSCWIFSSVGALEGAYAKATKKLVALAEQQVLDCSSSILPPTMGCSGGSMGPVYNYAEKHDMCTMESYPYKAKKDACQAKGCTTGVTSGAFTGWKGVAPVGKIIPASYNSMMSAVAQQPVAVSIEADKDVFHHYSSGVVHGACGQMPDHGVLVVGYGHDDNLKMDYWTIKNSWGKSWGEDGYVRILRGATGTFGRGECAVLNSPSYPIAASEEIVV